MRKTEEKTPPAKADVVEALREEWKALMALPPSESRNTGANHLLDRALALGIGKLD